MTWKSIWKKTFKKCKVESSNQVRQPSLNSLQKQEKAKKDKEKQKETRCITNVIIHSIHAKPDASSPRGVQSKDDSKPRGV